MTNGKNLRVVDVPCVDKANKVTEGGLRKICKEIKAKVNSVSLLAIVINGLTRGQQKSTLATISIYEQIFGKANFWKRCCVIITHYSRSPEQK
jgi:hypothetical protein